MNDFELVEVGFLHRLTISRSRTRPSRCRARPRLVDLVLARVRIGLPQLDRPQTLELEDLEHVDEVHAGRQADQREHDQERDPARLVRARGGGSAAARPRGRPSAASRRTGRRPSCAARSRSRAIRWWKWLASADHGLRRYLSRLAITKPVSRNGIARITSGTTRATDGVGLQRPDDGRDARAGSRAGWRPRRP